MNDWMRRKRGKSAVPPTAPVAGRRKVPSAAEGRRANASGPSSRDCRRAPLQPGRLGPKRFYHYQAGHGLVCVAYHWNRA